MKNKGTKIYRGEIKPVALDDALRRSLGLICHPSASSVIPASTALGGVQ